MAKYQSRLYCSSYTAR